MDLDFIFNFLVKQMYLGDQFISLCDNVVQIPIKPGSSEFKCGFNKGTVGTCQRHAF